MLKTKCHALPETRRKCRTCGCASLFYTLLNDSPINHLVDNFGKRSVSFFDHGDLKLGQCRGPAWWISDIFLCKNEDRWDRCASSSHPGCQFFFFKFDLIGLTLCPDELISKFSGLCLSYPGSREVPGPIRGFCYGKFVRMAGSWAIYVSTWSCRAPH